MSTIIVDIGIANRYLSRMSPEQSRAARGWLEWSQAELAARANVSISTVRDFEKGRHLPIANNIAAMQRAIEDAGIRLIVASDGAPIGIKASREA